LESTRRFEIEFLIGNAFSAVGESLKEIVPRRIPGFH
jgi:hypothetical protein